MIYEKETSEGLDSYIDVSIIKTCRKIRQLAKLERIRLDFGEHIGAINKRFVEYVEYSGLGLSTFMKRYLSNLQPFMIKLGNDNENADVYYCKIDYVYMIAVEIKSETEPLEEVVVSFPENDSCNTNEENSFSLYRSNGYALPVFADSICSKVSGENQYVVKVFVPCGLGVCPLQLSARKCKDVFLVWEKYIDMELKNYCDDYLLDLYLSDLGLDYGKIELFSELQRKVFTPYEGSDVFSCMQLLIDSFLAQSDYINRTVADTALVIFLNNLKLTLEQQSELVELLGEKYRTLGEHAIDLILDRIKCIMTICCNSEKDAFDPQKNYKNVRYLNYAKKLCTDVVCHAMKEDVKKIILFGAWARGDYIVDSNLDVAVLTGGNREDIKKYTETIAVITSQSYVLSLCNVRFVLIPYDEFQEKKSWYPYFKYIDTEGEVLYG